MKLLTGARYIADWRLTMKKKAIAHANIALVKYWGKRNASLNIPAVGSISVTLKDLFTITSVEFRKELEKDILILNGKRAKTGQEKRVSKFLDLFREEAGIKTFADVVSENNFPMGAGLASSASGFGALVVAASQAANLQHSPAELSELARRGSGSAARSIFGGFVEMKTGKKADGSDARAVPLHNENHWPLEMVIFITSEAKKTTGSTDGMNHTAKTSPYYKAWIDSSGSDLSAVRSAIEQKDFEQLGQITEFSCLKMHGLSMAANPGLLYWNSLTVTLIHEIRRLRKKGIPAYFTIDAGPQIKVICPPGYAQKIKKELRHIDGVKKVLATSLGSAARVIE